MIAVFGSNQYTILNYVLWDTGLDVFMSAEGVDETTLRKQVADQPEITIKEDDGTILDSALNYTVLKNIDSLPIATEKGNVNGYKVSLIKSTSLASDVVKNKANIEYIAAMSDVEL